jgi:2-methylcitrate dehydratase PrpD
MAQVRDRAREVTSVAEQLAAFAAQLRFEDLPREAVHRAKQIVLDTIGTTLGGYRAGFGPLTVAFAQRHYAGSAATIIPVGVRASMEGAAFANATMAKMLGMDDSHRHYGHVAAQVVPAALATAEPRRRSGRETIAALAAAYEVYGRIGRQVRRTHIERGYDIKGTVGTLGSAIAAGYGLGLDPTAMGHALALATSLASGLETYTYDPGRTHTKDLISGFAARNGVFAALLAEAGFRGPRGSLEGPNGFAQAFGEEFDSARAVADLGRTFEIESMGFKPHAGCRHVHQGVDAAREIRRLGPVDPSQVARVDIGTYQHAIDAPFRTTLTPDSVSAAAYSLPTATAIGLVFGAFYPDDIARYTDPRVQALLPKVHLHVDPAIQQGHPEKNGCVVRVTLQSGQVVEGRVEYAKGEPENMLTDEELEDKFKTVVGDVLPPDQVDRLIAQLWTLEDVSDISTVLQLASR